MKFFAVFAAIAAVAFASPAQWTVDELSSAIQNPSTPEALIPVLEGALNELMHQIYYGGSQTTTTVSTVVQDFSAWTLYELSEAIQDPTTNPQLVVYLEDALNNMMAEIMAGEQPEYVIIGTPIGILPVESTIVPTPVESGVVPAPVGSEVAPVASPLVQIIINVRNQQQEAAPAVVPEESINPVDIIAVNPNPINPPQPVELPQPVLPVIPQPVVLPEPVLPEVVIPEPVVLPHPVLPEVVIPEPVVLPEPILPEIVNPVDIIAVNPQVPAGAAHVVGPIV